MSRYSMYAIIPASDDRIDGVNALVLVLLLLRGVHGIEVSEEFFSRHARSPRQTHLAASLTFVFKLSRKLTL